MSLHLVHFFGKSLGMENTFYALVPEMDGPFSVLYLLHGLGDDCSAYLRRTGLDRYLAGQKLIVVMPTGGRSWYANDPSPGGLAYEDHIVRDLVEYVDRTFHTRPSRANRAIAGLSMGGFGAIMLAMRHPRVFSIACSHSGALLTGPVRHPIKEDVQLFLDQLPQPAYDIFELAKAFCPADESKLRKGRGQRVADQGEPVDSPVDITPHLYMDCGQDDQMLKPNQAFHEHLEQLEIAHEYHEFPGAHDWMYWDEHLRDSLAFVLAHVE